MWISSYFIIREDDRRTGNLPCAPVAFHQNTKYITNKFPIILSLILYLPTAYQTPAPHTAGAHTSSPHFSHSVRDVSRRSDCPAAEALFRKRIAKLPSYCRIMHTIHKTELPRMGAQGESRHGRRVSTVLSGIEALKSIIRTVSWQHSVANERTPLLQGSHSGGLRPVFP